MNSGKQEPVRRTLSPMGKRVQRICRELYGASQVAMAKDLGVSPPLVSKILRGEQEPGSKFLSALVKNPKVNSRWLMEGCGVPFLTGDVGAGPASSLPVFKRIQSEPRGSSSLPFVPLQFPLGVLFKDSIYLLEVQAGDAVLQVSDLKLAEGDLLALDGDASTWRERPHVLVGRLVAVRLEVGEVSEYSLGRIVAPVGADSLKVELFNSRNLREEPSTVSVPAIRARSRHVELSDKPPSSEPLVSPELPRPTFREIAVADILAYCVMMVRS